MAFVPMPLMSALAGALAAVYLGSLILEWAVMRRLTDRPDIGIPAATLAAGALGFAIHAAGLTDNRALNLWQAGIAYGAITLIVAAARMVALRRRQREIGPEDNVSDVFR
jgi:FtsH-binding integral membrane protein